MGYLVGTIFAVAVTLFASFSGFDRDRAFYPTVMIVIALYYVLFAAISGSPQTLTVESLVAAVFLIVSVTGFKKTLWLVVAALAGHGVFDVFHGQMIENSGVPVWWPEFCFAYDVVAAACLAWLLSRSGARAVSV